MLSGLGAIGAAVVTIYVLKIQINQTKAQEEDRRVRRFAASRARMQIGLSDTIQYANDAIELLKAYLDSSPVNGVQIQELDNKIRPVMPDSALLTFANIIETTDDQNFADVIADMISEIQVLGSRLKTLAVERRMLGTSGLHSYLMNAAKVYGYAASMFEYARREVNTAPQRLDWGHAITGLNLKEIRAADYPDLHAFMQRAKDRDQAQGST